MTATARHLRLVQRPNIGVHYDGGPWAREPNLPTVVELRCHRTHRHHDYGQLFATHVLTAALGFLLAWYSLP